MWIPYQNDMLRPQVVDGGEGPHICMVTGNGNMGMLLLKAYKIPKNFQSYDEGNDCDKPDDLLWTKCNYFY
jgi:hypothetical protein